MPALAAGAGHQKVLIGGLIAFCNLIGRSCPLGLFCLARSRPALALCEAVAFAVHLKDVDMMSEAVE